MGEEAFVSSSGWSVMTDLDSEVMFETGTHDHLMVPPSPVNLLLHIPYLALLLLRSEAPRISGG